MMTVFNVDNQKKMIVNIKRASVGARTRARAHVHEHNVDRQYMYCRYAHTYIRTVIFLW